MNVSVNIHVAEIRNQVLKLEKEIDEKIEQFRRETKIPIVLQVLQEEKPTLGQIPRQKIAFKALI